MDITVGGTALEKIIKKLRFDIDSLKREVDENAGVEFSPELIQSVVDKVCLEERREERSHD